MFCKTNEIGRYSFRIDDNDDTTITPRTNNLFIKCSYVWDGEKNRDIYMTYREGLKNEILSRKLRANRSEKSIQNEKRQNKNIRLVVLYYISERAFRGPCVRLK